MKKICSIIVLISLYSHVLSQNQNLNWCFGDSCGINFSNVTNPQTFTSAVRSRGSCVSISDALGTLLFYAHCGNRNFFPWDNHETQVWSSNNQPMQNTDSVIGEDWYHEFCIIPKPNSNHLYYLFTLSILGNLGMNYSIVDINQNGGSGAVVVKNHQIVAGSFVDGSLAIKHGNGRDWWYVVHEWQSNSFYICLITANGVSSPTAINAGSIHNHNIPNIVFNAATNKILVTNPWGLIEVFNFDRCTGNITHYQTVSPENLALQKKYFGSSISPSGQYMYVSNTNNFFGDSLRLDQYDLTAPNIAASKINIYTAQVPCSGGAHALAPDGKIYMAGLYEEGFPYSDTTHNIYTDNLCVINYPDSPGVACNFQPWSFYLGGNRCYWGLPNNPDYDLPRDSGSVCDTIQWTGMEQQEAMVYGQLQVSYFSGEQMLSIKAQHLKGKAYVLTVTDIMGRQLFMEKGGLHPPYFTRDLDCTAFSKGMYIVTLTTSLERLTQKLVKN